MAQTVILNSERKFYRELEGGYRRVLLYEDFNLLQTAKSFIPKNIQEDAKGRYRSLDTPKDISLQDMVLMQLMYWFKNEFFSWMDKPVCHQCGCKQTIIVNKGQPTPDERLWLASVVELYQCNVCKCLVRFPRYNHPRKLLDTRTGRCSEWANCFSLLCRALDYEVRLVVDWTDHVWTEVFSQHHNRWLHCDPCEARLDCPLLYEAGWGKKLSYIIAYSKDEIQDVTWRYTSNHKETMLRRTLCREQWLIERIFEITNMLQRHLPQSRKDELLRRRLHELVEFLTEKSLPKDAELGGRISGSLEWRIQRNEQGKLCNTSVSHSTGYVFRPQGAEISQKLLHVKYSSAKDMYVRVSDADKKISGWQTCTNKSQSVFRKVERDWKKAYLAREEFSEEAFVRWTFDFKGHVISSILILCESTTFENGSVTWTLSSPSKEVVLSGGTTPNRVEFEGDEFRLQAVLRGGHGQVAWQHTQLFRQPLDSEHYPFEVKVTFI